MGVEGLYEFLIEIAVGEIGGALQWTWKHIYVDWFTTTVIIRLL